MKKVVHRKETRGHADHGWLKANFSFSFANYFNPERIQFGALRVLNDDYIAAGMGFGTHPHDNMEIVTIPLKGAIAHKDSMGTGSTIGPNEVQIMSAGTGVLHSEFNASETEEANTLQTWVLPKDRDIKPRYDQAKFTTEDKKNKFKVVVAPDVDGAMWINQDAYYNLSSLDAGIELTYDIHKENNGAYLFLIEGELEVDGEIIGKRDAIGIWDTDKFNIKATQNSELLLIEVPMF